MPPYHLTLEAIEQLSTLVTMVYLLYLMSNFVVALTLSLDLLLIVATFLTQRYMDKHLFVRRMGLRLGYRPPYTRAQQRRMHQIYLAGHRHLGAPPQNDP